MKGPRLIFVAGPNGAGKSTFYETFLRASGLPFLNADRIAAALGVPGLEAAQVADAARERLLADGESFVTETVFSDPVGAKLEFLGNAIGAGYRVTLYYVGLASVQLSAARVSQRVSAGGHDVPPERLERRFHQSLRNLGQAIKFVPEVHVFDNSSSLVPYRLVLSIQQGRTVLAANPLPAWVVPVAPRSPRRGV